MLLSFTQKGAQAGVVGLHTSIFRRFYASILLLSGVDFLEKLFHSHLELSIFALNHRFGVVSHHKVGVELVVFEITALCSAISYCGNTEHECRVLQCFPTNAGKGAGNRKTKKLTFFFVFKHDGIR